MTLSSLERLNLINGAWAVEIPEGLKGGLLLRREAPQETQQGPGALLCYGFRLEFKEDGKLIDSYFADCGLDPNLHHWSGKWELNDAQNILSMRIDNVEFSGIMRDQPSIPTEDYKHGWQSRIIELTDHEMLLERIQIQ